MASILKIDELQSLSGNTIAAINSNGSIANLNINDVTINSVGGLRFPTWTEATRPTSGIAIGTIGFDIDLNELQIYNGLDTNNNPIWIAFSGTSTGGTALPASYQALIDTASAAGTLLYVDSAIGSNSNAGTSDAAPLASLSKAVELASNGHTIYVMPGRHINMETQYLKTGRSYGHGHLDDYGKEITFVAFPGRTVIGDEDPYGCSNGADSYCGNSAYGPYCGGLINANSKAIGFIVERNRPGQTAVVSGNAMFSQDAGGYTSPTGLRGEYLNCVFRNITNNSGDGSYNNGTTYAFKFNNGIFECPFSGNNYQTGNSGSTMAAVGYTRDAFPTSGMGTISQTSVNLDAQWKSSNSAYGVYVGTYAWDENVVLPYPGSTSPVQYS